MIVPGFLININAFSRPSWSRYFCKSATVMPARLYLVRRRLAGLPSNLWVSQAHSSTTSGLIMNSISSQAMYKLGLLYKTQPKNFHESHFSGHCKIVHFKKQFTSNHTFSVHLAMVPSKRICNLHFQKSQQDKSGFFFADITEPANWVHLLQA